MKPLSSYKELIFKPGKIVIIVVIIILLWLIFFKTTSLDDHGFYYKNALGVYTNHAGYPKDVKFKIPAKLEDADAYDFMLVHIEWKTDDEVIPKYAYAKSDMKIYFNNKVIEGADIKTFEYLGGGYSKDGNNIYFKENKVKGVDYSSFKHLGDSVAVDKKDFYYMSYPILKKTDKETYILFDVEASQVVTNDDGILFIQDQKGTYKVEDLIKVKEMDGEYHQASRSDDNAQNAYSTRNMTVYSTHVLY